MSDVSETRLVGTSVELPVMLDRFLLGARNGLRGLTMKRTEDGFVDTDATREALETFDRALWELSIRPVDGLAPSRCRDAYVRECAMREALADVRDILARADEADGPQEGSSDIQVQGDVHDQ